MGNNDYISLIDRTKKAIDKISQVKISDSDVESYDVIMEFMVSSVGAISMHLMNCEAELLNKPIPHQEILLVDMRELVRELTEVIEDVEG